MFNEYRDVLTVQETAEALGLCEASVYRLIHRKEIGYRRVGRKFLIPKCCLVNYIKAAQYIVSQS